MTLAAILRDETLRQSEFPVTRRKIFLAHAAVCPLPRRVSQAMADYLQLAQEMDQEAVMARDILQRLRETAARLVSARSDEIALVGPTSLALSFVAGGLRFDRGENVVVYKEDYPSNVYPWMALAERGVEIRFIKVPELGHLTLEAIQEQIDRRTRLVALASCHFITGYRLDLPRIGDFLKKQGILFCLDAIQTLGAFPTPLAHVDFLAADAHKWLLGPCAAGLLAVRKECQATLQPTTFGWHNVRCPDFVTQDRMVFPEEARRYEAGTANLTGLVGLQAALDLLLSLGIEEIAAELLRKRAWVIPALQSKGYQVLEAETPPHMAGAIISFLREKTDLRSLHQKLAEEGIVTSLRTDRSGRRFIRISPHFYNTDEELSRFLEKV